ncbi:hypothetical protein FB45DRAFT_942569 [Roridomyces roridus]|uniref:Short-chain dehydrogenase/reductase n=1 Tax=Roridomyces roridus TaxID=1738132 RepID=A0AAD7B5F1_9AGAR|nr:hypothetical protein FB45DRAFT_942569 [Roridomyces roridus]
MPPPTFDEKSTAAEVVSAFADHIRGKNVLVTGTSINGIGFEAARAIARHCNLLIITGYNSERLKLSEEAIKKEFPTANVRQLNLDLASQASVRAAAAQVSSYPEPLHVLIHNAAAGLTSPYTITVDGLELQMATAHINPFLFTKLLAPKLLAAGTPDFTPRVVFVSSAAHVWGSPLEVQTLGRPDPAKFTPGEGYAWSKQAMVLAAIELSKRSQGRVNAYSLHPGAIYTNVQQREGRTEYFKEIGILNAEGLPNEDKFPWKTIPQGAATTAVAAFDTRLDDTPGAYLWDCVEANSKVAPNITAENAEKLWTATEDILGEKFQF